MVFDVDRDRAAYTRRRMLDAAAADCLFVVGMHVEFPCFARVARDGRGFRIVPELSAAFQD